MSCVIPEPYAHFDYEIVGAPKEPLCEVYDYDVNPVVPGISTHWTGFYIPKGACNIARTFDEESGTVEDRLTIASRKTRGLHGLFENLEERHEEKAPVIVCTCSSPMSAFSKFNLMSTHVAPPESVECESRFEPVMTLYSDKRYFIPVDDGAYFPPNHPTFYWDISSASDLDHIAVETCYVTARAPNTTMTTTTTATSSRSDDDSDGGREPEETRRLNKVLVVDQFCAVQRHANAQFHAAPYGQANGSNRIRLSMDRVQFTSSQEVHLTCHITRCNNSSTASTCGQCVKKQPQQAAMEEENAFVESQEDRRALEFAGSRDSSGAVGSSVVTAVVQMKDRLFSNSLMPVGGTMPTVFDDEFMV